MDATANDGAVVGLRILCLHDSNSNALELHQSLTALDERLYEKHGVELVYINSPLIRRQQHDEGPPRRIWWEPSGEKHVGLDASLLHIRQTWNSMPFTGILGVGEGAAMASLLPLIGVDGLEFGIFIRGKALLEDDEELLSNWDCLHIVEEESKNGESSRRLARQLGGDVQTSRTKSISSGDLNVIGKFVVAQKKRLRSESTALALKSELHRVEQEAARVVAEHASQNPPKALMAIISPHTVGGWTGRKRREPNEEGGGAPCPSDFLLQKEKRSQLGGGRQHPNAGNDKAEESKAS